VVALVGGYIPENTWPIERLGLNMYDGDLDLTCILLMPQLTRVDLGGANSLYAVQSLGELRHLQKLTITKCVFVSTLPTMTQLSSLRLMSCEKLSEDCSYLNSCPNLRSIEMEKMTELKSFVVELTGLESLSLVDCRELTSVRVPRSVQRLHITGCGALSSVEWSTSPVDADLKIVRDMRGDYTLA
jgi:hypothetical protein